MGNYIAAPTFFFYRACLELTLKFLFYIYFTKSNSPAMKKMILVFTVMVSCTALQAQNYKRVFYKDQTVENKNMSIQIVDAVATDAEVKFKMKIKNLMSTDYILYKATESSFKIDGKTISPEKEKPLIIRANDNDYRVVNIKGNYKKPQDYEFVADGFYKINSNAKGVNAPDFKLPASQNEITAGPFVITLVKVKKETARTDARFKVKYTGDKVAVFDPNKVAMKMPDGKEYANYHSDRAPQVLTKEEFDFEVSWKDVPKASGDMQFAEMIILWRDAFKEIAPEKIPAQTFTIAFDKAMTEAKK